MDIFSGEKKKINNNLRRLLAKVDSSKLHDPAMDKILVHAPRGISNIQAGYLRIAS